MKLLLSNVWWYLHSTRECPLWTFSIHSAAREREWSQGTVRWTWSVRAALDGMTRSTIFQRKEQSSFPASRRGRVRAAPGRYSSVQLHFTIGPDKKNQEDGRFRECLIRFSDMFGIDGKDMPQDRVLDLLLKRLDDKDAEKCLYAGYLLRDVDGSTVYSSAAMSWIRFVLDAAIMNKVYDFFEALKKQEGKEKNTVDFLYLYYKFMAHSDHGGTDVSSAAIDTKMLAKIEKAAAFAASLDERTSRYFMIPVIVNGNALCGIYIMGTAFFSNEEEHVHGGPYAGLNVMNLQRVEEKSGRKWDPGHLSEEDFKGSTYFYDFSESLDPENVLAVFRDVSAMETVSAFLFRDNGSAPEGCPPEYAPYFCEQPGKSASEEAAEKMLQSADEAAERLHLKTCTQLQFR